VVIVEIPIRRMIAHFNHCQECKVEIDIVLYDCPMPSQCTECVVKFAKEYQAFR
jgi:hypothetical protein